MNHFLIKNVFVYTRCSWIKPGSNFLLHVVNIIEFFREVFFISVLV